MSNDALGAYNAALMDWTLARERLGAELIGAREQIAARWRLALREQGLFAVALDRCASELILQAGAALADGMPAETPWRRCGALLLLDARDQGRGLAAELSALWRSMSTTLTRVALTAEEDLRGRELLAQQLDASLRGASSELRHASCDDDERDPALRFGGPTAVVFAPQAEQAEVRAA